MGYFALSVSVFHLGSLIFYDLHENNSRGREACFEGGIQEFQVFSDGGFYIWQTRVILTNKSDGIFYIVPVWLLKYIPSLNLLYIVKFLIYVLCIAPSIGKVSLIFSEPSFELHVF